MNKPDWPFRLGSDPLYRDVPFEHTVELPVLGVPVRFESNAAGVGERVKQAFESWRALDQSLMSNRAVRVRVVVDPEMTVDSFAGPVVSRMPDNARLLIRAPGGMAHADVERGDGVIYAAPGLVDRGERFERELLEAVVLILVTHLDRTPLHAALVVRNGSGVLLAAPAGTGKSTLAYAAQSAGWQVAADDTTYVQLAPRVRFWGAARMLRVPLDVRRWFPELQGAPQVRDADGDEKLSVPVSQRGSGPPVAERAAVCILARSGPRAGLERLNPATTKARLGSELEPGFDRFRGRLESVLDRVAARGGWLLHLAGSPADALKHLDQVLADLDLQTHDP